MSNTTIRAPALSLLLSHSGQLGLEAIEVLFVRLHGKPLDLVAFGGGLEEHAKGEPGLAGKLGEGRRDLKGGTGHVLEDNPLGLHDLHKHALVLIVSAVGTVHDEPPDPAPPHVELLKRARKALRAPPAREMIRVGPCFEHVLARPVIDTRADARKSQGGDAVGDRELEGAPIARREELWLAPCAPAPYRTHRVDDVWGSQAVSLGEPGVARLAAAEQATFAQQLRPRRAMDGPVHAAPSEQRGVRGIDDGPDEKGGDVGVERTQGGGHVNPTGYGDSTEWEAR